MTETKAVILEIISSPPSPERKIGLKNPMWVDDGNFVFSGSVEDRENKTPKPLEWDAQIAISAA
jgi:hypothetical protein